MSVAVGTDTISFVELIADREDEFPLLARAVSNSYPTARPCIEWLCCVDGETVCWKNYTQIVRFPYDGEPVEQGSYRDPAPTSKEDALTNFLRAAESIVEHGTHQCRGVRQFLGREPNSEDWIALRPLREPRFDREGSEWLAEFSLEVHPR